VSRFVHLPHKIRFYHRPLIDDDAISTRVADGTIGQNLVVPQYSIQLSAQAFNCLPAGVVEEVRTQFHADAVQGFKGMRQQKQLALGVERRSLHALAVPGAANLNPTVGLVDIPVTRHAYNFGRPGISNGEGKHSAFGLALKPAVDLGFHL
jgi:hypothetical protein